MTSQQTNRTRKLLRKHPGVADFFARALPWIVMPEFSREISGFLPGRPWSLLCFVVSALISVILSVYVVPTLLMNQGSKPDGSHDKI